MSKRTNVCRECPVGRIVQAWHEVSDPCCCSASCEILSVHDRFMYVSAGGFHKFIYFFCVTLARQHLFPLKYPIKIYGWLLHVPFSYLKCFQLYTSQALKLTNSANEPDRQIAGLLYLAVQNGFGLSKKMTTVDICIPLLIELTT